MDPATIIRNCTEEPAVVRSHTTRRQRGGYRNTRRFRAGLPRLRRAYLIMHASNGF